MKLKVEKITSVNDQEYPALEDWEVAILYEIIMEIKKLDSVH